MKRFLQRLFGRKRDQEIIEIHDVDVVGGIYAAFGDAEKRGNDVTELRVTPNAYAWLCAQLQRETVTHVAGVPVRVIEVANA